MCAGLGRPRCCSRFRTTPLANALSRSRQKTGPAHPSTAADRCIHTLGTTAADALPDHLDTQSPARDTSHSRHRPLTTSPTLALLSRSPTPRPPTHSRSLEPTMRRGARAIGASRPAPAACSVGSGPASELEASAVCRRLEQGLTALQEPPPGPRRRRRPSDAGSCPS